MKHREPMMNFGKTYDDMPMHLDSIGDKLNDLHPDRMKKGKNANLGKGDFGFRPESKKRKERFAPNQFSNPGIYGASGPMMDSLVEMRDDDQMQEEMEVCGSCR